MRNLESTINKSGIQRSIREIRPHHGRERLFPRGSACDDGNRGRRILRTRRHTGRCFASHDQPRSRLWHGWVTLVGMVAMLCSLTDNISGIGPDLAVAFLSTLYGVLSARMVYIPAASKLRQEVAQKRFRNYLITEGLVMLVAKKTPMYVQDRLNSFPAPGIL